MPTREPSGSKPDGSMTSKSFFWLMTIVATVAALWTGIAGVNRLVHSPTLAPLASVRIHGLVHLGAAEVIEASGLHAGDNLVLLNLETVKNALARHPRLQVLKVEREFPDTVVIHVAERDGVALVSDGRTLVEIEADGHIVAEGKAILVHDKPIFRVSGPLPRNGVYSNTQVFSFLDMLARLPPEESDLRMALSEIRLEPEVVVY